MLSGDQISKFNTHDRTRIEAGDRSQRRGAVAGARDVDAVNRRNGHHQIVWQRRERACAVGSKGCSAARRAREQPDLEAIAAPCEHGGVVLPLRDFRAGERAGDGRFAFRHAGVGNRDGGQDVDWTVRRNAADDMDEWHHPISVAKAVGIVDRECDLPQRAGSARGEAHRTTLICLEPRRYPSRQRIDTQLSLSFSAFLQRLRWARRTCPRRRRAWPPPPRGGRRGGSSRRVSVVSPRRRTARHAWPPPLAACVVGPNATLVASHYPPPTSCAHGPAPSIRRRNHRQQRQHGGDQERFADDEQRQRNDGLLEKGWLAGSEIRRWFRPATARSGANRRRAFAGG